MKFNKNYIFRILIPHSFPIPLNLEQHDKYHSFRVLHIKLGLRNSNTNFDKMFGITASLKRRGVGQLRVTSTHS